MRSVVILFLILFSNLLKAQNNDLDFLIQKIKVDYPGYAEKTKDVDFDKFIEKVISNNRKDTFKMMAKIVDFFNDRHLDLFKLDDTIDTVGCKRDLARVYRHFGSRRKREKYEGFWVNEYKSCVIAILRVGGNPLRYKGYVIERREGSRLIPGMEFYDFEKEKSSVFFTRSIAGGSNVSFYVHAEFRNDSCMTAGPYHKWHKLKGYNGKVLDTIPKVASYTTGRWLDSSTYVITIPGSNTRNGKLLDSLIGANPRIRTGLENLIVDIRDNNGGSVATYNPILPLIYTNPILMVNSSIYCTKDDIEQTKEKLASSLRGKNVDSSYVSELTKWIKIKEDNLGKFVKKPQDTIVMDSVLVYPRRVAFIINYGCQSAAEMAILNAQQSTKVTLFGEHTMGAVDYLNFYPLKFPSGRYELFVATTRRTIPFRGKKLDGIGIYPNVEISDTEKDWVEFVRRYYENH